VETTSRLHSAAAPLGEQTLLQDPVSTEAYTVPAPLQSMQNVAHNYSTADTHVQAIASLCPG